MVEHDAQYFGGRTTRRALLRQGLAAGAALPSVGLLLAGCGGSDKGAGAAAGSGGGVDTVRWISPRGTLEVMDDYNLWVADKQGYFKALGIEVKLEGGPTDATAPAKFVAENQSDLGYPSPGVLASSIDTGMPIKGVWEMISGNTFDFAVPTDSPIQSPKDLAGKTIAVQSAGWKVIIDPMLVEVGVDPKTVKYQEAGPQWGQVTSLKKADAALTWEGLRAQWDAQGMKLRYLIGQDFSKQPANVYAARTADLQDDKKRDVYIRFFKGVVMGFEFAKANPQAAAQITYEALPALKQQMKPQLALVSMMQNAALYGGAAKQGDGWGYAYIDNWQSYLDVIHKLGQTTKQLKAEDVVTNELVAEANKADVAKAQEDAKAFKLNADFEQTTVPTDLQL
jgi:NitT/TauT family transport system substrate-binding protein